LITKESIEKDEKEKIDDEMNSKNHNENNENECVNEKSSSNFINKIKFKFTKQECENEKVYTDFGCLAKIIKRNMINKLETTRVYDNNCVEENEECKIINLKRHKVFFEEMKTSK